MLKKLLITLFLLFFILLFFANYSMATTSLKNDIMDTGNSAGNLLKDTKNTIIDAGTKGTNEVKNMLNGAKDGIDSAVSNIDENNTRDYEATKTATSVAPYNSSFLGFSSTVWSWFIILIVGLVIIALVMYYSSQYTHKNYPNE